MSLKCAIMGHDTVEYGTGGSYVSQINAIWPDIIIHNPVIHKCTRCNYREIFFKGIEDVGDGYPITRNYRWPVGRQALFSW